MDAVLVSPFRDSELLLVIVSLTFIGMGLFVLLVLQRAKNALDPVLLNVLRVLIMVNLFLDLVSANQILFGMEKIVVIQNV